MPKNVRLRPEIKELAQEMERRLREKQPLVAIGYWAHWRQMPIEQLIKRLQHNVMELIGLTKGAPTRERVMRQAADVGNLARFVGLRAAGAGPKTDAGEEERKGPVRRADKGR